MRAARTLHLKLLLLFFTVAGTSSLRAQQQLDRLDMGGTLGPYRIGASFWLKDHASFVQGSYFYATQLKDIPLTATSPSGATLDLREPAGGAFHLHYTGNGSEHGAPLNFNNSVALDGTWTKGSQSLPVHLGFLGIRSGRVGDRRYADVTSEPDPAFEARVQSFLRAVLAGDRAAAGKTVSYPLEVNGRHRLKIRDSAALDAHWNEVFTPAFLTQLKTAVPHNMFVRNGMAMLGDNGLAWFDRKGASSLNLP